MEKHNYQVSLLILTRRPTLSLIQVKIIPSVPHTNLIQSQAASSRQGKLTNWATLNRKVLSKFGFTVPADVVENIIAAKPNVVEVFLNGLKQILERELNKELEQVLVFKLHDHFLHTDSYKLLLWIFIQILKAQNFQIWLISLIDFRPFLDVFTDLYK